MNNRNEPQTCPVCYGAFVVQRHSWLRRCVQCGCLASTLEVRLNADNLPLDEALRSNALRALRNAAFAQVLNALADAGLPERSRILDVGCAHGWFLRQATTRGYRSVGIEPNRAIAAAARVEGFDVRIGLFPEVLADDELFDAIVFNDVLEHLPDIADAIAKVRTHLTPGGLFVANLPLSTGLFYRLADSLDRIGISGPFERMWQKRFASPHRFYFTALQLMRLAERNGFKLVARTTLPSLRVTGLYKRLRYDKTTGEMSAILMWLLLVAMAPLVQLLPQDIGLLIFELVEPPSWTG